MGATARAGEPTAGPAVSGGPSTRFMFCIACPAAPLPRLSIADVSTSCDPAGVTATWHSFVCATRLVSGWPRSKTFTNASPW